MDSQIIAAIVVLFLTILNALNAIFGWHISIGTEELTAFLSSVGIAGSTAWIWYKRTFLMEAPAGIGDITATGFKRE